MGLRGGVGEVSAGVRAFSFPPLSARPCFDVVSGQNAALAYCLSFWAATLCKMIPFYVDNGSARLWCGLFIWSRSEGGGASGAPTGLTVARLRGWVTSHIWEPTARVALHTPTPTLSTMRVRLFDCRRRCNGVCACECECRPRPPSLLEGDEPAVAAEEYDADADNGCWDREAALTPCPSQKNSLSGPDSGVREQGIVPDCPPEASCLNSASDQNPKKGYLIAAQIGTSSRAVVADGQTKDKMPGSGTYSVVKENWASNAFAQPARKRVY
ncbi:hypothetical protein B0H16DRAFT_1479308 [Mycena metata]|uniref:Uncharacterized protein n=1 Tax=Mycena metata TaxID=1033252 RepID=A0AAD7MDS3_9AGAR|nr:hypothetical protein B0H16DRAFT_1479308 [Mycena metata]